MKMVGFKKCFGEGILQNVCYVQDNRYCIEKLKICVYVCVCVHVISAWNLIRYTTAAQFYCKVDAVHIEYWGQFVIKLGVNFK